LSVLADTSAMIAAQRRGPATVAQLDELADGDLWICDVVRLELLRGADNPRHMRELGAELDGLLTAPIDEQVWERAEDVYDGLARLRGGRHRGVQLADVLIAAAAEAHELPVLHADSDFELIAQVTGQQLIRLD
jgi:predicted nucleic acid-binding protein